MNESLATRSESREFASRDLSKGVIVVFSGGPVDIMNPADVLFRMDDLIAGVNGDPFVVSATGGQGLKFVLIPHQPSIHIHQSLRPEVAEALDGTDASPIILVGHSNGGAAVVDLARDLESQGKTVDLAFTADSVFTLLDIGHVRDVNRIPPNVLLNVNSFVIPDLELFWLLPFPIGKANQRESGTIEGILNIGLPFQEPGAIAHHDAFYDLAGGDKLIFGGSKFPEMIKQTILAVLRGETRDQVFQEAKANLQTLANDVRVPIDFQTSDEHITLEPAGTQGRTQRPRMPDPTVSELRDLMLQVEALNLRLNSRATKT